MAANINLTIEAESDRFDPDDDRWEAQVADLCRGLLAEVGQVARTTAAQPGTKGGLETILVTVSSAGSIKLAVDVFKMWLARDRSRRLPDGAEFVLEGDPVDNATMQALAQGLGGYLQENDDGEVPGASGRQQRLS